MDYWYMASLNHSRYSLPKSLSWLRAVQIGFGALTIVTSIFALAFPGFTYISVVWVLAVVLFFVGIEEIIVGIFSRREHSQRKICRNSWPLIFNIPYLVQSLLMNKKENKHEPSKQSSEDYHAGDNCHLHTEVIYCK